MVKRSDTKRPTALTLTTLLVLTLLLSSSNTATALNPLWSPLDGPHHQEEMKAYSHPDWGLSFAYPAPWTIQEEAEIVWALDLTKLNLGDIAIFAIMAGPPVSDKSLLDVLHSFEIEEVQAEPSMPRSIAGQPGEGAMFQAVEPVTGITMTGYIALLSRGEMAFAVMAMATSDTWAERWPILETIINSLSFEGAVVPPSRTPLPLPPTELHPPAEGPTITTLDPLYGPVGTQVTIQGSGFGPSQGDSLLTFNSIPLGSENILSWGENQIVFSVPVGAVSGSVQVLVGEGASNRVGFVVNSTFTQPQPEDFLADPETGIELVRGEILLSFRPGTAQETIEGIISNVDGRTLGYDPRMDFYQVAIPQTEPAEINQVVDRLAEVEEVTFVSPRLGSVGEQVSPVDGQYPPGAWGSGSDEPTNWGLRFINMPVAWDTTIGNAAVRAAVVDSGFDLGHEDLMGNIFIIGPGNSAADHGTHVAGIVGAQGNNGEGISGVNWQTGLCLFDYDYGTGQSDWTSITNRMMEAIDRGARVINLSAGINWWRIREEQGKNPPDEEPLTPDEIAYSQSVGQLMAGVPAYAAATNRDVLFVFSAGNDSIPAQFNGTTLVLPLFNNILVVANIEEDGSRADSSNYGPFVNIAAPGDEIYSTVAGPQRYDYKSGTSMAAPHVTGLAALLWAMNPSLNASQVRDCILAGAASREAPVWEKYDTAFGPHGFYAIDAAKALDACRDKVPQPVFQPVPAWKQPAVIACIEDWIQKYTAAMNQLRPERAPWHIDQYGHLIGRLMEGYAPDDWITRWEGNRYKRIWYGYANASAPGVPRLRDYCGGKVDPSPVPVPPPVPPAPGTEPWNDPAVQDCIQKWMRVVEAYHNKTRPERAPWRFSEYGHIIGRLMSYQKPDNWDTVYEGNLYKWMWLVWGEASYPGIPSLKDVCQGGASLPTLPLPGVEVVEEPTPTPTPTATLTPTPTPTATSAPPTAPARPEPGIPEITVRLQDGDARTFADPPDIIAFANIDHVSPPSGVTITDSGEGLWRYYEWVALGAGQWIEAICTTDTTAVGVQFWGDTNDGWARVLVDGTEVWTGNTYGKEAKWPGESFVKYLEISGLAPGPHTVRVESMGISGDGGGSDVTVFFFGFRSTSASIIKPIEITSVDYPSTVISDGDKGTLTVSWSGDPVFPVTVMYRPTENGCPPGVACSSPSMTFEEEQNPLVFPEAVWCYGFSESVFFDYEVLLVDARGVESAPYPAAFTCAPLESP